VVTQLGAAPPSLGGGVGTPVTLASTATGWLGPLEALPVLPELLVVVPPPPLDPAEHPTLTLGWQAKPSPQSASALHGSCHLNAHWLVVVVVQVEPGTGQIVGSVLVGAPASHFVFAAQPTWATPPEQASAVCV
jgi:hypothetical protein